MYDDFQKWIAAFCVWKEARGEGDVGMRAVLHVISNRARLGKVDWAKVVYERKQFTSMTYSLDQEFVLTPRNEDERSQLEHVYNLADEIFTGMDTDLTLGATHYFNPTQAHPNWAANMTKTVTIGHHDFYK